MGVCGQRHAPVALSPGKRPGTHCTGGWVGPRVGLYGCRKYRPHRDSISDRPGRSESLCRLSHPGLLTLIITFNALRIEWVRYLWLVTEPTAFSVMSFVWLKNSLRRTNLSSSSSQFNHIPLHLTHVWQHLYSFTFLILSNNNSVGLHTITWVASNLCGYVAQDKTFDNIYTVKAFAQI
jgi:hypothetical protein